MERLSGDFNRGYTKAIQDMETVFNYVQNDLSSRKKKFNFKLIIRLLQLFLKYRENFRENGSGFIRWNLQMNDLEYYTPKRKEDVRNG